MYIFVGLFKIKLMSYNVEGTEPKYMCIRLKISNSSNVFIEESTDIWIHKKRGYFPLELQLAEYVITMKHYIYLRKLLFLYYWLIGKYTWKLTQSIVSNMMLSQLQSLYNPGNLLNRNAHKKVNHKSVSICLRMKKARSHPLQEEAHNQKWASSTCILLMS